MDIYGKSLVFVVFFDIKIWKKPSVMIRYPLNYTTDACNDERNWVVIINLWFRSIFQQYKSHSFGENRPLRTIQWRTVWITRFQNRTLLNDGSHVLRFLHLGHHQKIIARWNKIDQSHNLFCQTFFWLEKVERAAFVWGWLECRNVKEDWKHRA